jgi:curli biogenesis system outer membrane secretion channel CsgG
MKILRFSLIVIVLAAFMLTFACVPSQTVRKTGEKIPASQDWLPDTLAILHFDNFSVTDKDQFDPLKKGISAMLITELRQSGTGIRLLEREKIRSLMDEIRLNIDGTVDQSSAIKVGKIYGAQAITFGSFIVLEKKVRIDARIVRVETSEVVMADSVVGSSSEFMELVTMLAGKIAGSLNMRFRPEPGISESDIRAAVFFSRGVEAMDRGDTEDARRLFAEAVKRDPAYQKQVDTVMKDTD